MGRFLRVGSYIPIPDNKGHWLSKEILTFMSEKYNIVIDVPSGSLNNLASIPIGLRNIFSVNGPHRPAAALHDYLYGIDGKLPNITLTRKECDKIFKEAMLSTKHDYYHALTEYEKEMLTIAGLKYLFVTNKSSLVNNWKVNLMYRAVRMFGWMSTNAK